MNGRPARRIAVAGLLLACLLVDPPDRAAAQQAAAPDAARLADLARQSGKPQIPGLKIVYLHPLGNPADASHWKYIIAHQTEGPAGSALALAQQQFKNPTKRGVTIWVEPTERSTGRPPRPRSRPTATAPTATTTSTSTIRKRIASS